MGEKGGLLEEVSGSKKIKVTRRKHFDTADPANMYIDYNILSNLELKKHDE